MFNTFTNFISERFGIKPNICQRSPRKTPTEELTEEDAEQFYNSGENDIDGEDQGFVENEEFIPEIKVRQSIY